jgi:ABC-type Fe3+ transport system substrate-binding protein
MRCRLFLLAGLWVSIPFFGSVARGAEAQWNDLVAKARKEGTVVLATSHTDPSFRQAVTSVFPERFGVKVEFRAHPSGELVAIIGRECAAGRPSIDVILSGLSEVLGLHTKEKECYSPIKPGLMLPEVVDVKNWQGGFLKWNDSEGQYFLQTSEYVEGWTTINTDQVQPAQVATAQDFLKPEFTGKIASFDPRRGGPGQATATFLLLSFGDEYVRRLYLGQKVVYTTEYRQLADWVTRGAYSIGLGQIATPVEPLRKARLPIAVVTHKDFPGFLSGGFSVLKGIKDSPHPNAATLLLNWLAAKEGQEIFSRTALWPSRRIDVQVKEVPDYLFPKPGVKYLDNFDLEFYSKKRPETSKKLIELLGR